MPCPDFSIQQTPVTMGSPTLHAAQFNLDGIPVPILHVFDLSEFNRKKRQGKNITTNRNEITMPSNNFDKTKLTFI